MARPAKSTAVTSKHLTKEEVAYREAMETKLKGNLTGMPKPPKYLTKNQKKIFKFITDGLASADVLSGLDNFVLTNTSIAIDRLQEIETMINDDPSLLLDSKVSATRSKYESCMWRGCSELCLSPQARAKIGTLALSKKKEENPLLSLMEDDEE